MRVVLATAIVASFFLVDDYIFQKEIQEIPSFAVDILADLKVTSKTITKGDHNVEFTEPMSGKIMAIYL